MPVKTQFATVHGFALENFNQDGNLDILLGGNFYRSKSEVGIYDRSRGLLLLGDDLGGFTPVPEMEAGFFVEGAIRDVCTLKVGGRKMVLVAQDDTARLRYIY